MAKFAEFASVSERKFNLLKVEVVSYPNNQHMVTLRPTTGSQEMVSITASPSALAMELERIVRWLQETAPPA